MFELTSKTGNKVKVINVTEARAKFAAVLSDCNSAYVITKNNKPQRVIIDYEEFQRLQKEASSRQGARPDEGEQNPRFAQEKKDEKTAKEPAAQNRELSEKNTKQSVVKGLLRQRMEQVQSSDYFGADEDDDEEESYGQEEEIEILKEPNTPNNEEIKRAKNSLMQENGEKFLDDIQTEAPPTQKHTSEEDAYFQKYRKLYEGRTPQQKPIQTETSDERRNPEEGSSRILTIEAKVPQVSPNPISRVSGDDAAEESLPSLEDLLKDLDIDPVGDDSGALSEQEINNLIHRITND